MNGFDKYRKPRSRGGQCRVCDGKVSGRVTLTLQDKVTNPGRTAKDANRITYPAIDSTSGSYCEKHAVGLYEALRAVRETYEAGPS